MGNKNYFEQNIQTIKAQIEQFDNKANILITIVSIVFAISLSVLSLFDGISLTQAISEKETKFILLLLFSILYFVSFVIEMVLLVLVIYPRSKRVKNNISLHYYKDVAKLTKEEITKISNEDDLDAEVDQLMNNAKICVKKHRYLICAIWTLIPLFAFIIALFFSSIL